MKALKLALLSIAAVLAAPTFAAQPEHLDVPTLNDAFRRLADSEAATERTTPFGWNDGENRIFRRGEWKFSFNDREITQIRTPKDADVRQFAYFLLKEPWRKRLSPRLREGAELTPGERMAIRVVYLAWIDSLRQLASLGYQHVSFHTCVNSRDFPKSQGKKNVSFGDGSIYGDLKQRFFDRIPGGEKDVAALSGWGASFLEPRNDRRDLLKRIIHRGDEKFVSAMRLKQLNEYFYVEPRVSDFTGELTVIGGMGVDQIASWRDIVGEVLREIGVLASIKDDIGSWRDTFEAKTLSEKDASDLDEEMARLVAELDGANEEAVRRARLVFFDYPLVRACAVFRRDVGKSTSIIYSAETEQENLRNAVRSFLGNIAGTNMLANIKSSYAANEYAAAMGAFKKAAGKKAFGLLQETGIRELGSDTMGRIAEGRDPWSPNEIPDPYANLDQFRREILADAQKAVLVAHSNLTAVAKALAGVGSIRKSLKGAGEKASAALAEAEDTLASALDLPEAKNQAKKAKTWAEQAQDSVSKANLSLDSAESKNGRVKSLNEEIRDKKDEATLNATDAPDIARKAANDAMDIQGSSTVLRVRRPGRREGEQAGCGRGRGPKGRREAHRIREAGDCAGGQKERPLGRDGCEQVEERGRQDSRDRPAGARGLPAHRAEPSRHSGSPGRCRGGEEGRRGRPCEGAGGGNGGERGARVGLPGGFEGQRGASELRSRPLERNRAGRSPGPRDRHRFHGRGGRFVGTGERTLQ